VTTKLYTHPDAEGRKVTVEATADEAEKYLTQGWVEKDQPKSDDKK